MPTADSVRPPWFNTYPNGEKDTGSIPLALARHPDLQRRGIVPRTPMKPGYVYSTSTGYVKDPIHVIKILDPDTEELAIYERLLREIQRPNNHTIPAAITTAGHPLLIMPHVCDAYGLYPPKKWSLRELVAVIFQVVEGVEFLHSLHIAHLDICWGNVLGAHPRDAAMHKSIVANRVYIIDFGASKQLALGPGVQRAITLPDTQLDPPDGLRHFDPYSWDVHCTGRTLKRMMEAKYQPVEGPHWLARQYIKWLIGDERGCTGVCRCRPTARAALLVIVVLGWALSATGGCERVVDELSCLFPADA